MKLPCWLLLLVCFLPTWLMPAQEVDVLKLFTIITKVPGAERLDVNDHALAGGIDEIRTAFKQLHAQAFKAQTVLFATDIWWADQPAFGRELTHLQGELIDAGRKVWFVEPLSGFQHEHSAYVILAADPPHGQGLDRFLFTLRGKSYSDVPALLEAFAASIPARPSNEWLKPTVCLIPADLRSEWLLTESNMGRKLIESLKLKAREKKIGVTLARSHWGVTLPTIFEKSDEPAPPDPFTPRAPKAK